MRKFVVCTFSSLILISTTVSLIMTQTVDEIYHKFVKGYHTREAITLPYHLFIPENYNDQEEYPLVLCLHGAGERGDDSLAVKKNSMATVWARDSIQARWPCFILVPQCPPYWYWTSTDIMLTVIDLMDSLTNVFTVDTNRIYITGLSMGGIGTWWYLADYPDKFAAAVPVCGSGDTLQAGIIKHIPIWAFHGALDQVVPVSGSRNMIATLEKQGASAVYTDCNHGDCTGISDSLLAVEIAAGATLLYTEYENYGHSIWDLAYNEPFLLPWVFAQSRGNQSAVNDKDHLARLPGDFRLAQNYPNPFNPGTTIKFQIPISKFTTLKIYNVLGEQVTVLVEKDLPAGEYTVRFNAAGLASGVYFYSLLSGSFTQTRKLILVK